MLEVEQLRFRGWNDLLKLTQVGKEKSEDLNPVCPWLRLGLRHHLSAESLYRTGMSACPSQNFVSEVGRNPVPRELIWIRSGYSRG